MKRVHFDSKGPVPWHYFFWEPWGCAGCLLRTLAFVVLLALFLFLLSQFRSCRNNTAATPGQGFTPGQPVSVVVPPINEDDIIDDEGRQLVANRLNVLFGAECGQAEYESWVEQFHQLYPDSINQVIFYDPDTKLMGIQVDADRRVEMLENLNDQIPDIPFLVFEENVLGTALRPNDSVFRNSEHAYTYNVIKAFDAWDVTMGDPNTIVAVVDSYFDLNHPDLASLTVVMPRSLVNGDENVAPPSDYDPNHPRSEYTHGTHVASLAVGGTNDGVGVAGMAPKCRFMPISMGARFGSLAMVQGVLYAVNHGATVINVSAGSYFTDAILELPVEQQIALSQQLSLDEQRVWDYIFEMCQRNYITMVWAAGNQDVFTALDSSKRSPNTIRVSAIDRNMTKADFSNFGNFASDSIFESTLSAPGVDVAAAMPGTRGYTLVPGTSFSSPIVAGCVGLVKSVDATLTTEEIIQLLQRTGVPARGAGASTIGPVVQIGPAIRTLEEGIPTMQEFLEALGGADNRFHLGRLWYQRIEDSTALPPIYVISFLTVGSQGGFLLYSDNRTPQSAFRAAYQFSRDGNKVKFNVSNSERVAGEGDEAGPGAVHMTFEANGRGKVMLTEIDTDWFSGEFTPCYVNLGL